MIGTHHSKRPEGVMVRNADGSAPRSAVGLKQTRAAKKRTVRALVLQGFKPSHDR